jgi:CRP-like cAMP-binding protein
LEEDQEMKTLTTISLMERIFLLRRVSLFANLKSPDLKAISQVTGEHIFAPGEMIAEQGEPGDEMFILISGEVGVKMSQGKGKEEKEIARRKPGDVVGEMALISQEPRMASLVAVGEVRALCIEQDKFIEILRLRPETSLAVMRILCQRLRESSLLE